MKIVLKSLRDGSTTVERHFAVNPQIKHKEFGAKVWFKISKNLKSSI